MPVLFGALLALNRTRRPLDLFLLILSILAMLLLQAGANILNDIHDTRNGLDTTVTPVSGGVVRGLITLPQAWRAVFFLFAAGSALGTAISLLSTPKLLAVGVPGVVIGWIYSQGDRRSLKFRSLGDLAVSLSFGILGTLGSWMVQTRSFSWIPVIWSLPIALLIIAILHANNWRDSRSDLSCGVRTIANRLGDRGSLIYYHFLIFSPFAILLLLTIAPPLIRRPGFPPSGLIVLLSLPLAFRLSRRARDRHRPRNPLDFITLDGGSARLNLLFGLLCSASLLLDYFMGK